MMTYRKIIILIMSVLALMLVAPLYTASAQENSAYLSQETEQAWIFYVQRRLVEQIIRDGNQLKVFKSPIGMEPSYVYVSINHPYRIMCNDEAQMGTSIAFGTGEENDIIVHLTGIFSPEYKNEPDIDILPTSLAAKRLDERLCSFSRRLDAKADG